MATLSLDFSAVGDNVTKAIAEHLPLLEDLSLKQEEHEYTVVGMTQLVQRCGKLKVLNLGEELAGVTQWQAFCPGLMVTPTDNE